MTSAAKRPTRRRRKAERPGEILQAAFEEFSRQGYAGTTLDRVAERAGVTKGTIYVYFDNKEQLFIAMVREFTRPHLEQAAGALEDHTGSTADFLRDQLGIAYDRMVDDRYYREIMRVLIAEAARFPALADRFYKELQVPRIELLTRLIQRGVDRGEFRRSAVTQCPEVIVAPLTHANVWALMFGNRRRLDLKRYFQAHVDMVLRGLLVTPE
jgi:AcrR family transcriptional regulator